MDDAERINLEAETADKTPPDAMPHVLPGWTDEYLTWRLLGGKPAERPPEVPHAVPTWAVRLAAWAHWYEQGRKSSRPYFPDPVPRRVWPIYERAVKQARAAREPQHHPAASVFAGRGIFAADRPIDVLKWVGAIEWAALLAVEPQSVFAAEQLHARGVRVVAWEEHAGEAGDLIHQLGAQAYLATVEGPNEAEEAAARQGLEAFQEKALVCNDVVKTWPQGWTCLPEAYTSLDGNATADQMVRNFRGRGATVIVPVVLLADEGGHRLRLADYRPALELAKALGAVGYGIFRVETAAPDGPKDALPL